MATAPDMAIHCGRRGAWPAAQRGGPRRAVQISQARAGQCQRAV